jgi:hypothetical protein
MSEGKMGGSSGGGGGGSFMSREFGMHNKNARPDTFESNLVFVIMSLKGDDMWDVFAAVKDECAKLGLKPTRVDENIGSGLIIKEIITLIERAEFLICDLTHERPNVYYELGYAHGVGNQPLNILLIAKEGTILHFDIAPLRVQYYRSTEQLRSIVSANLARMIQLTRKKGEPSP